MNNSRGRIVSDKEQVGLLAVRRRIASPDSVVLNVPLGAVTAMNGSSGGQR
jgi:hypothetical protein